MSEKLRRRALGLSYFTVVYNVAEAMVSLAAGAMSGSAALLGFGLDSVVESLSGGVMIWRFRPHPGLGAEDEARREILALRLVGYSFLAFGAIVLFESLGALLGSKPPEPSLLGIVVALVSLVAMPALFVLKRGTAESIGSASLLADSRQTLACMLLSLVLLVGLGLNYLWGLWWADSVAGLLIVAFLVREGVMALKYKKLCEC